MPGSPEQVGGRGGRFFCIGPPKTGTTVLAHLLDRHPDIACLSESFSLYPDSDASIFWSHSDKAKAHGFDAAQVKQWSDWWVEFRGSDPSTEQLVDARRRLFAKAFPDAMSQFGARCGASVVGDKWGWYIRSLSWLVEVFPDAKLIHSVRDPRAVWNSGQRFMGRQRGDQILTELLVLERLVQPWLQSPALLVVRYEDLVLQPDSEFRRIFEFLQVSPQPACAHGVAEPKPEAVRFPDRWDWVAGARGPLVAGAVDKWRREMTPEQLDRVQRRARNYMETYGYELEV